MPARGRAADEIAAELDALGAGDGDVRAGRVFGLGFHAGDDVKAVVQAAHDRYLWHNALNPDVFPSLRRMASDVVSASAWLLSGGAAGDADPAVTGELAGFLVSGGTEALLMAVKTAKVRGLEERGVEHGNVVLPMSAHAAFSKGCEYFELEERRVPVRDDFRADVGGLADACDDGTVLLVGSAPQYPQGVIDPVADIAALAADRGTSCHVDACMGGFTLPFLELAGLVDPSRLPWDFRVPGVTTISADIHKYGFTPKGASVIVHRDKASRRRQTFLFDGWLGGLYGSSGILGSKPGGPIAAAWASFQYLGVEGFVEKASMAFRARQRLEAGVRAIDGLTVLGEPEVTLLAIASASGDIDPFLVHDRLVERRWYLDRQGPPDSLHASCAPVHDTGTVLDEFLADLGAIVSEVRGSRTDDRATNYAKTE
jgi:glutamate/tyrosine decarboxylase-like PLP-dependent enzyme